MFGVTLTMSMATAWAEFSVRSGIIRLLCDLVTGLEPWAISYQEKFWFGKLRQQSLGKECVKAAFSEA